ncbi:site-specific integrase [Kaistella sp. 97-N-M2]|uniref:site-specific integrase n=1 Tax=Kaistella sp. 97-N-M2 TaxID=2908645 RepID=UPI001F341E19|nr:site-specific integrase [Kaistella sp. 97-N-M2]UJF29921.1 site-specific integrase [Kaistella sp. 97-N-M2]
MIKYYYNEFINPSHVLPLGYFLFSCYTGLRISDIQSRTRAEILKEKFQFSSMKTDNFQYMRLNDDARKMVEFCPNLFDEKLVEQKINFHLKAIAKICKIKKNISMHVGRHTFATTFIRNKGDIYRLQKLLGHANIRHTVKYVHIVSEEFLDDIDLISY